ncbi:calcium-binding protein [Pseudovibrio sp. Tun.PSC04-5.I4]|uniref:calcium-binding protein n=1 Tax=Pseudovibrio sp. Tun.PSC04-5.I4 TaxID=1798213 RepID=UPI00088FA684|nr:calcium-binding protein [Pseudovibrio sp. Tun.PSC04-5.I4]SDQ14427.1 Ca2+-binding protein, RTX toxin-related [Pseudovibrio sp. Tun.PSC04-5.I4]
MSDDKKALSPLQDHHIIPQDIFDKGHPLLEDLGDFFPKDGKKYNIMGLPNELNDSFTRHQGPHDEYTVWVRAQLDIIDDSGASLEQKKGMVVGLTNVLKVKFATPGFLEQLNSRPKGEVLTELENGLPFDKYKETSFFKFGELVDGALAVGANGDWKYVHGQSALNAWQFDKVNVADQEQRLKDLKKAYDAIYNELKDELADPDLSETSRKSAKDALDGIAAGKGLSLDDALETLRGDRDFTNYVGPDGKASILFSSSFAAGLSAKLLNLGDGSAVVDAVSLGLFAHGLVEMGVFSSSTSLASMARALANSNILPKALGLLDDLAVEIGKEAAITGIATVLGVGLLWKGYEIYESLDGLKGALEFAGQHSDNETIDYLNETVKEIEKWFGQDGHSDSGFVPEYAELAGLISVAFKDFPQTLATIGFAVKEHLRAKGDSSWTLFSDNDVEGALFHLQKFIDENGSGSLQSELQTAMFNSDDLSVLEKVNLFPDRCFPKGTLIAMWDGSQKAIEEMTVSDQVLAFDEDGNRQPGEVTTLFRNTTQEWLQLSFEDGRAPLHVTPGHRFLSETGDYLEIGQMSRLGGGTVRIVNEQGAVVTAQTKNILYSSETAHLFEQVEQQVAAGSSVNHAASGWQTYNFEVSTHHNYVAEKIRVHNDSIFAYLKPHERPYVTGYKDLDGDDFPDFVVIKYPGSTLEKEKYLVAGRVVEEITTTDKDGNLIYIRRELDEDNQVVKEEIKQLTGAQAGESIGKSLTPFLANAILGDDASLFERVATDTVLNTLLGNLGEFLGGTIHRGVLDLGELALMDNIETIAGDAFEDLGGDFVVAGANAAISVINQLIMAEIFSDVAGDGVGGEVFEAVVGTGLDILLTEGAGYLFETDVFTTLFQDVGLSADSIKTIQGIGDINPVSMVMTAVINAVLPDLETLEGQIASTVTSIAFTAFSILTQTLTAFTGPIGAILGFIVGSIFDTLFEKHPQAFTHVGFDDETGQYVILDTWSKDGGNKEISKDLAQAYVDSMNGFVDLVKAESHNFEELGKWSFGHYEEALKNAGKSGLTFNDFQSTYLDAFVRDLAAAEIYDGQRMAVRALESAKVVGYVKLKTELGFTQILEYMNGELFGVTYNNNKNFQENIGVLLQQLHGYIGYHFSGYGDPRVGEHLADLYLKIEGITDGNSIETYAEFAIIHDLPEELLTDPDLTQMVLSRMQIADDYHKYLENRATINALIAAEPESAFAAGWMATFIAAKDLGLDEPYILDGDAIDNVFYTADGDDVIDGKSGDDLIKTYGGDDVLKGGTGDDTLVGGSGDDQLEGGADNDTYVFAGSFGKDVIIDSSGSLDTIRFEWGITLSDLKFVKDGNDLLVYKLDPHDPGKALEELNNVIRVKNWQSSIERFEFTDGTIKGRLSLLTDGNDSFTGTSSEDLITGFGGNDTLKGGSGNDTLVGGEGNDQLLGGSGDDIYVFERNFGRDDITETSGTDTIRFADGITLSDLKIVEASGDLKFYLIDPANPDQPLDDIADVLTIKNWSADNPHVERFEFADGTVLREVEIREDGRLQLKGLTNGQPNVIYGSSLDDFVYGSSGNDILSAGKGEGGPSWQHLYGYGGDDTYLYGKGGGNTLLNYHDGENDGSDTVRFTDLNLSDFTISIHDYGSDNLNGKALNFAWFSDGQSGNFRVANLGEHIERFEFADGTVLSKIDFFSHGRIKYYGTDGDDIIKGGAHGEEFYGGAGADHIDGSAGSDTANYAHSSSAVSINMGTNVLVGGAAEGDKLVNVENVVGSQFDDTIIGDDGNNALYALNGTDHLEGRGGNDTLNAYGNGADYLDGGAGVDAVRYRWSQSAVTVNLIDQTKNAGDAAGDTYISIENIVGSDVYGDHLTGDAGNNRIWGEGGDDTLVGGAGEDQLYGGDGSDTFAFNRNFGKDVIKDFAAGIGSDDIIRFDLEVLMDFDTIIAAASDNGSDTVIKIDDDNSITLTGILKSELHIDDFQFV